MPQMLDRYEKWRREQFLDKARHAAELARLRSMTVEQLRKLWDEIGDDSFSSGYDCADIHRVLNEKGDGAYCVL